MHIKDIRSSFDETGKNKQIHHFLRTSAFLVIATVPIHINPFVPGYVLKFWNESELCKIFELELFQINFI